MRRIGTIHLRDFGRFENKSVDLSGRLIGIVGPNGSGKSTILKALKFACTGEIPRVGRSGPVRIGRTGTDQPHVRLDFTASNGESAHIVRWVPDGKRDGRRRLICGNFNETTTDAVNRWFEGDLGVSVETAAEVLFVGQGRLTDVITDRPARRAEMFHRLFGLDAAERARTALVEHLATVPTPPDPGALESARVRHAELTAQLDAATSELMRIPAPDPNLESVKRVLSATVRAEALLPVRDRLRASIAAAERVLSVKPVVGPTVDELEDAAAADRKVKAFERSAHVRDRLQINHTGAAAALDDLRLREPPIPGPAPVRSSELVTSAAMTGLWRQVSKCAIGSSCPVCGSTVSDVSLSHAADANLAEHCLMEEEFTEAYSLWSSADSRYREWKSVCVDAVRAVDQAAAAVEAVRDTGDAPTPDEVRLASRYPDIVIHLEKFKKYQRDVEEAVRNRTIAIGELESIDLEISRSADPVTVRAARELIEREERASDRRRSLKARVEVLTETHRQSRSVLDKIEVLHRGADIDSEWRTEVGRAIAVLHRDAAPAATAAVLLRDLTSDLNDRIAELGGGFRVSVDAEGSISAGRTDGPLVPVEMMSGGEQAVLALAWRMATADRVAPSANILCLDEPTYGLDEDRIEALRSALISWRPDDDRQLVVVTHDRRLIGAFDTLIEL